MQEYFIKDKNEHIVDVDRDTNQPIQINTWAATI